MGKELSVQKKKFCEIFLRTMDAERAARTAGLPEGLSLLGQAGIKRELRKLQKEKSERTGLEEMILRLQKAALAPPNDAVKLAFLPEGDTEEIDRLDLSALAEMKRGSNGATEIKLVNRLAAMERLISLLGGEPGAREQAAEFFEALEKHAGEDG